MGADIRPDRGDLAVDAFTPYDCPNNCGSPFGAEVPCHRCALPRSDSQAKPPVSTQNDVLTQRLMAATSEHLRTNDQISRDITSCGTILEQKSLFQQGSSLTLDERDLNPSFPKIASPNTNSKTLMVVANGGFACPKCARKFQTISGALEHIRTDPNYQGDCSSQGDQPLEDFKLGGIGDGDHSDLILDQTRDFGSIHTSPLTLFDPTPEQIAWSAKRFIPHKKDPAEYVEAAVSPVNQYSELTSYSKDEPGLEHTVSDYGQDFNIPPPQAGDRDSNGSVEEHLGETRLSGYGPLPTLTYRNGRFGEGSGHSQMVPFIFEWEHPATEVFVTGTFDDWSKTILLDKVGGVFAKEVLLPLSTEKICYKFVVDGYWKMNANAAMESDNSGNLNNIITHEQLLATIASPVKRAKSGKIGYTLDPDNYSVEPIPFPFTDFSGNLDAGLSAEANNAIPRDENQPPDAIDDPNWDLKSLSSLDTFQDSALGSSLPSDVSASVMKGLPRTAQEEILIIIISDVEVRSLFEKSARRMNKLRFIRNVRRLLLLFHYDLSADGLDPRELDALRIIRKHAQWLASRSFDVCNPDSSSNTNVFATYLNQQLDKRSMLEKYLASMVSVSKSGQKSPTEGMTLQSTDITMEHTQSCEPDHTQPEENDYSSEEDPEESKNSAAYIDYSMFPNLERIKNFIVGGAAFEKLRRNASQWIHPVQQSDPKPGKVSTQTPALTTEMLHVPLPSPDVLSQKSSTESGTTDVTVPDIDSDSDDDDSDLSSDLDIYDGTSDDRILDPKIYFAKLRSLEQEVFENSGIAAYKWGVSLSNADDDQFICGSNSSGSLSGARIDTDCVLSLIKSTTSEAPRGRLLRKPYSILVRDGDRIGVAKLIQTEIDTILKLGTSLENLLRDVISIVSAMPYNSASQDVTNLAIERQDDQIGVTLHCLRILSSMGFSPHLLLNDSRPIVWECTFQCLDLAILSYAGVHIQRFDLDHLGNDISSFEIPRLFVYHGQTSREPSSSAGPSVIILRRRQFQCLDKFLGEAQPWVFHQDFCNLGSQRLYLSTTISALSDIWGPSWKIIRDSEPARIQQVDIGNGAILPWSIPMQRSEAKVETHPSEVFCH
ncbi:hypothetical protein DL95DRAFT_460170 [Leptodontidium sp. 2 PMI_412]|nr:hypothetical protein DL95DRAFT_460170 [Leptodontidium sp. 2 PMI_412]